jgi:hypothetical protein
MGQLVGIAAAEANLCGRPSVVADVDAETSQDPRRRAP